MKFEAQKLEKFSSLAYLSVYILTISA